MKTYMAAGLAVVAGAALLETALIPGLLIGGAAVLAPGLLPKMRRGLRSVLNENEKPQRKAAPAKDAAGQPIANGVPAIFSKLGVKQAVAKTITFRVLVTALDFTSNYVVIGEVNTAAGLSTLSFILGPLLYLGHEAAWNYLGPAEDASVDVKLPSWLQPIAGRSQVTMSRAMAKTITFRTIATVVDFTTIYVVVGDALTAAGLSAFAFVVGPFVYIGHEKLWDYYSAPKKAEPEEPTLLLPAPASPAPAFG
jgi:uncharacterized membrane protein